MDYFLDQQTGQGDADIVGLGVNAGFYTGFDGTNVYFRVRLGETLMKQGNPKYSGLFWIGIDADANGALDVFIGIDNQGSKTQIVFADAGTGLNVSPNTTSIQNAQPIYTIQQNSSNYNYQRVSAALQPGLSNLDLNSDGKTDAFLSIRVPFFGLAGSATLQGATSGLAGIMVNENSVVRYVIATSTQSNSLNQDIGGVPKVYDATATWAALGALSPPALWTGVPPPPPTPTPEAGRWFTAACGVALMMANRKRRRG
jgi:hypothetical protein